MRDREPQWNFGHLTAHPEDLSFSFVVHTHGCNQLFDVTPDRHDRPLDYIRARLGVEAAARLDDMLDAMSAFVKAVDRHDHEWVDPPREDDMDE